MPKVLNKHKHGIPAGAVYIGRGSPFGNRHVMKAEDDRARVIAANKDDIRRDPALQAKIAETAGRDVVCFCAPKACHGDFHILFANSTPALRRAWLCDEPGAEAAMAAHVHGAGAIPKPTEAAATAAPAPQASHPRAYSNPRPVRIDDQLDGLDF